MASRSIFSFLCIIAMATSLAFTTPSSAELCADFYQETCPKALSTIQKAVRSAVRNERRMGGSLLRLHFHDCFVKGCDASVLLDDVNNEGEKNAPPNKDSLRGFDVVDDIKREVDEACGGPVVSCADILAVAARDSVVALGGPTWEVLLGRRDSKKAATINQTNAALPNFGWDLPKLLENFKKVGLDESDLVALSGGHTLGFSRCTIFRTRLYNDTNINSLFARRLRESCPLSADGDGNLEGFDGTPLHFDNRYFKDLVQKKGLLHSDQALFSGVSTDALVKKYSRHAHAFAKGFAVSMVNMGNNKPLTGKKGQIRVNCRRAN